jgi:hypothetical protein
LLRKWTNPNIPHAERIERLEEGQIVAQWIRPDPSLLSRPAVTNGVAAWPLSQFASMPRYRLITA